MQAQFRRCSLLSALVCLMAVSLNSAALAELDHSELMVYQDENGTKQPIKTVQDWAKRREQILAGMQEAMGPLPDRSKLPPFDVKVLKTEKGNGFERQTISFVTEGTDRLTAYLYLPLNRAQNERRPAIVALHPTGALGKGIVAGEGPKENRAYGLELADAGTL